MGAAVMGIVLAAWAAPVRSVEVSASGTELHAALIPADYNDEYVVCADADCPPGLGRVGVVQPRISVRAGAVEGRGRVRTELAWLGPIEVDVMCAAVPVLVAGAPGQAHVQSRGCRIERLIAGVPAMMKGAVVAALEPLLNLLVDEQLRVAPPYDLLGGARGGLLAPYSADRALQAPASAQCVQQIRKVAVRSAPDAVVVGLDVACD